MNQMQGEQVKYVVFSGDLNGDKNMQPAHHNAFGQAPIRCTFFDSLSLWIVFKTSDKTQTSEVYILMAK